MKMKHNLREIVSNFDIYGNFVCAEPYGGGHINDTYAVTVNQGGTMVRYIIQRINHTIFKQPVLLMENVQRVTSHISRKSLSGSDESRRNLTLIPSNSGDSYYRDESGNHWRTYIFIENARTLDAVESSQQAFEAARAFGRFQKILADLPSPPLHATIPDFHHTPRRFAAFERAVEADVANRAALAKAEIEFALEHKPIASVLVEGGMPERVTHNDTKLNNVMLDAETGEGVCVIDLDTVMPGLAMYDVGDMVRTTTSPAREDECDLSKVTMQFPMFEALMRGYLSTAADFLTKQERAHLAVAGKVITFEIGLRFLTDFLSGDTYFKTHRENHNLDRTRTQFKLVESIERQEPAMTRLVEGL